MSAPATTFPPSPISLYRFHYAADTADQKGWAYDPQSRRTRSIVVNHQAASFGANYLIEDHAGFQGYLHNHTWTYIGEQVVLVPGFIGGTPPEYGGKGGWYPQSPWELRTVVVLEATPNNSGHPYGKRRMYLDRQTYAGFMGLLISILSALQTTAVLLL